MSIRIPSFLPYWYAYSFSVTTDMRIHIPFLLPYWYAYSFAAATDMSIAVDTIQPAFGPSVSRASP